MTPERLEALLWDRIDGTISAEDRAELDKHLAQSSEARLLAEQLIDLNELLAAAPKAPRPAGLREAIDRGLAEAQPPSVASADQQTANRRRASTPWRSRLLPLAAGFLIGAAVVHLLHLGAAAPVSDSSAAGSMAATPIHEAAPVVEIDLGSGVGAVSVTRDGVVLTVEAVLELDAEMKMVLEATSGDLLLVGTEHAETSAGQLAAEHGRLAVSADGPGRYRLMAETEIATARARLTIEIDGRKMAERWLEPAAKDIEP